MGQTVAPPKYYGVCWHKRKAKYIATARYRGRLMHLGYFDDPREAAERHDCAVRILRMANGKVNFKNKEHPLALVLEMTQYLAGMGAKIVR